MWLTAAGDGLFKDDPEEPAIFTVEDRQRVVGFDLLAVAPQQPKFLDPIEQWLPELPIEDGAGTGRVVDKIGARFGRFFHEFSDRADREQAQRRDRIELGRDRPAEAIEPLVLCQSCSDFDVQVETPEEVQFLFRQFEEWNVIDSRLHPSGGQFFDQRQGVPGMLVRKLGFFQASNFLQDTVQPADRIFPEEHAQLRNGFEGLISKMDCW